MTTDHQVPQPAEHDETANPDRAATIRRAVELIDSTPPAELQRYFAQTRAYEHLQADAALLRVRLTVAEPGTPQYFGTWKLAQQLLHAAGLPH